jgi:hypothetical protein
MTEKISDTKAPRMPAVIVWFIGGTAWLLISYLVPHYAPYLRNVTDGQPIQAGVDLVGSVLDALTLFHAPRWFMGGLDTFVFGGIAAVFVLRASHVAFRDEVHANLTRSVTSLVARIRNGIGQVCAMAACRLESYRVRNSRPGANRSKGFLQRRLEMVMAATAKQRQNPQINIHPAADPVVGQRVKRKLSAAADGDTLDQKSQPLIQAFGNHLKVTESRVQEARTQLINIYADYNALRPRSNLKEQRRRIAAAEKNKELAEDTSFIAVNRKQEALDGTDQIETARRNARIDISVSVSALQMSDDGDKIRLATKQLLGAIASLRHVQDRYPTAAELERTERTLKLLETNLAERKHVMRQLRNEMCCAALAEKRELHTEMCWAALAQTPAQSNQDQVDNMFRVANGSARQGRLRTR